MALSESRKKANAKYDKAHRAVLACKVDKEIAARFRLICQRQGVTVNAVLYQYVIEYIKMNEDQE